MVEHDKSGPYCKGEAHPVSGAGLFVWETRIPTEALSLLGLQSWSRGMLLG